MIPYKDDIDPERFIKKDDECVCIDITKLSWLATYLYPNKIDYDNKADILAGWINNIKFKSRKVVLNASGEHSSIINLLGKIIPKLNIDKDNTIILSSVEPKFDLGIKTEINYSYMANWMGFAINLKNKYKDWKIYNPNFHFLVISGTPNIIRADFLKNILDIASDKIQASFGLGFNNNRPLSGLPMFKKLLDPYPVPLILDKENFIDINDQHEFHNDMLLYSLVNIVQETLGPGDELFISEKSFKPFAWFQIPLWLGPSGTVEKIRDMGFDVFDDIFDHSYNNIQTYYHYKLKLLEQIKKFIDRYPKTQDLISLRNEIFNRLEKNNTHLYRLIESNPKYLI